MALATPLTLGISACAYFLGSDISVRNQSLTTLSNLCVTMASAKLRCSDVPSGNSMELKSRPSTDGTIAVSFVAGGRLYQKEFGYVAPGIRQRHTVVVLPSFEMMYAAESL